MLTYCHSSIDAGSPEWFNCEICVVSDASREEALGAAQALFELIAPGRKRLIRQKPKAESSRDFEKDIVLHRAYARFSFSLQEGEAVQVKRWDGEVRYTKLSTPS